MIYTLQYRHHVRAAVRAPSIYSALRTIYNILIDDYYEFALRHSLPIASKPEQCKATAFRRACRIVRKCELKVLPDTSDIGRINPRGNKGYDFVVENEKSNGGSAIGSLYY
jgi:hypothetical protein